MPEVFDLQPRVTWDRNLICRYDLSGPRYTSYPTAPQMSEAFTREDYIGACHRSNRDARPLSLYFHIPFCSRVCYYCACNKIITANRSLAGPYLERLGKEMATVARWLDTDRPVNQLHWGGGTPTYISDDEKRRLMAEIKTRFRLLDDDSGEYAIEIHPGDTSVESIRCLRELGFNRLSMGIQDFDPDVQRAVNRFNSVEEVRLLVDAARQQQFHSISMDLIYGLPHQNWRRFHATLQQVIALSPDRLSLFNYAHLPHLFKVQKQIDETALPEPGEKLEIMERATEMLQGAGYLFIGMDHFAKPRDELARAQREGRLQRNFQGYATHGDTDLVSFGVSAISAFGDTLMQNHKNIEDYNRAIDSGQTAIARGISLSRDDRIRGAVIMQLICHFALDFEAVESQFSIDFQDYFVRELESLEPMQRDGLVSISESGIRVTLAGRLLIRRICMIFDAYLQPQAQQSNQVRYSKII